MSHHALAARLRTALFDLDRNAARLEVRGFAPTAAHKRERLESSGAAFIDGYRAAIRTGDARQTSRVCDEMALPLRGFAYEGAGMGLSLLDLLTSARPRRFTTFLEVCADPHAYMVHVGAGWAIARCPWGAATFLPRLDPVFRWLTVDGIGFHAGFFHPARLYERQRLPLLRRCEPEAFDAGLGRALWFACGAQPHLAVPRLEAFDEMRHPAMWSGLGLAVTYAGGASAGDLETLARAATSHRPRVAAGAAFAAKARQRARNPAEHTDQACRMFCGMSAAEAADLTDRCREGLALGRDTFQLWRERLVRALTPSAPSSAAAGPGFPARCSTSRDVTRMRVVFFGHVLYSRVLLARLAQLPGVDLVGVVTRQSGPGHADFCSLIPDAALLGVPCLDADAVPADSWDAWLCALQPDIGYAMGWSTLLGRRVIDAFRAGIIGYHPAPLPRNRGHHPIVWALALGLHETASTLFFLDEGVDTGDIVSQVRVPIAPEDDARTLYERLTATVARQLEGVTADLVQDRLVRVPQDHAQRTVWRRRGYADGRIDWRMSTASIHNLVRALTRPYVGAHCVVENRDVKVWRTRVWAGAPSPPDVEPGRVLAVEDRRVLVRCGDGALEIVEHDFDRLPALGVCLP